MAMIAAAGSLCGVTSIPTPAGADVSSLFADVQRYSMPSGVFSPVVGDLNGDGLPDIVAGTTWDQGLRPAIAVLLGNPDGTFAAPQVIDLDSPPGTAPVGLSDVNGDGRLDLVLAGGDQNQSALVAVLLGNGDGTFQAPIVSDVGGLSQRSAVLGSFGPSDVAVGLEDDNSDVVAMHSNGDGTYTRVQTVSQLPTVTNPNGLDAVVPFAMTAADLTGHSTDLAIANFSQNSPGNVAVMNGNGDGTFQNPRVVDNSGDPTAIAAADLNLDGRTDLIVGEINATSNWLSVLLNQGYATFQVPRDYPLNGYPAAVTTGDFNADGSTDVAVAEPDAKSVGILLGNADGTLQPVQDVNIGASPDALTEGTYPGGQPLLVAATHDSTDVDQLVVLTHLDRDLAIAGPSSLTVAAQNADGAQIPAGLWPYGATDEADPGTGPQLSCTPGPGDTLPVGTTTVSCSASDLDDTPSTVTATFTITVTDGDLALHNVPPDMTTNATGPNGATVTYASPTATDEGGQTPPVSCSPASGSTFPIGTTTVTCSATASDGDDSASPASASFQVTVSGPAQQMTSLYTYVSSVAPGTSLPGKVQSALSYYNAGDVTDTCGALGGVINEAHAQTGKHLTAAQANAVISAAARIRAVLAC